MGKREMDCLFWQRRGIVIESLICRLEVGQALQDTTLGDLVTNLWMRARET